ncbi:glycosyltransferase [Pontivivens insulae]|uniref:Poly-beta-1,6-N-acetyl-D-glucosamine synthase n=1 Tax=Pontivivens insulae TaxID=1639689 RepID=A0A2R8AFI6_9RHOB|nr:glycosyltransferase [Pontivivens insulae]RED12244.1 cellulose synthase/poly-beta-1,6-N-acetylglucosamine synthase-like glycosyltransferase [Pontivivens insulae]SPF31001.1 Poly-beta-1,6-N-acetyl-D-glucosamine synthase [Pontivivens insulae]
MASDDLRSQNEYWSVDSAPRRFSGRVAPWRAFAVVGAFLLLGTFGLWGINELHLLNAIFPNDDLIFSPYSGAHSIPMRIFTLSFFIAFALFCNGTAKARFLFWFDLTATYVALCGLLDVANIVISFALGITFSLHLIEIESGLLGFAVFSWKLLERGRMPSRIDVDTGRGRSIRPLLRLIAVTIFAAAVSIYVASLDLAVIHYMRGVGLLGGIGPGVFLFLPVFFVTLYVLARLSYRRVADADHAPAMTVIVPAHNEEYIIQRTIAALDQAAAHYAGDVHLLVLDNNSEDATDQLARVALSQCEALTGEVVFVERPGKANALNAGLRLTKTPLLVRVDADTQVSEDAFTLAAAYFAEPDVGVVGGIPLPPGGGPFDKARLMEVVTKHGFYQIGMASINAVVGVPGMFAVYRTELPRRLGGFVGGMNGEDTDISLRIGELGYRLIVEPRIRYISEVPVTLSHMREQRMRWFRSIYHICSRCRDVIFRRKSSTRGRIILPYMLINSARRTMMVPMIVFGVVEYVTHFDSSSDLAWQAIFAVIVGMPTLVAIFAALVNGMPRGLLYLPQYLLFRMLRSWFTLESMLSISIDEKGRHIFSKEALSEPRPADIRVA